MGIAEALTDTSLCASSSPCPPSSGSLRNAICVRDAPGLQVVVGVALCTYPSYSRRILSSIRFAWSVSGSARTA